MCRSEVVHTHKHKIYICFAFWESLLDAGLSYLRDISICILTYASLSLSPSDRCFLLWQLLLHCLRWARPRAVRAHFDLKRRKSKRGRSPAAAQATWTNKELLIILYTSLSPGASRASAHADFTFFSLSLLSYGGWCTMSLSVCVLKQTSMYNILFCIIYIYYTILCSTFTNGTSRIFIYYIQPATPNG